jgi:hypothetical protein
MYALAHIHLSCRLRISAHPVYVSLMVQMLGGALVVLLLHDSHDMELRSVLVSQIRETART